MLNSNGDGSSYVKYVEGQGVAVGAGGSTQVTVTPQNTIFSNDINAQAGGLVKSYEFYSLRLTQGVTPLMTASFMQFSGTAAAGNANTTYFTKVGLRKAGSIVGAMIYCENVSAGIEAGAITASLLIGGVPTGATVICGSGSTSNVAHFGKDTYSFGQGALLTVQLTSSADLQCVASAISGSWTVVVDTEY